MNDIPDKEYNLGLAYPVLKLRENDRDTVFVIRDAELPDCDAEVMTSLYLKADGPLDDFTVVIEGLGYKIITENNGHSVKGCAMLKTYGTPAAIAIEERETRWIGKIEKRRIDEIL